MFSRVVRRRDGGFTLIEIMIVVLIIGVLLAVALPGFARARDTARARSCVKNLRTIEEAKVQAALDLSIAEGGAVGFDILVPNYLKSQPICPAGGTYDTKTLGTESTCSIPDHVQ